MACALVAACGGNVTTSGTGGTPGSGGTSSVSCSGLVDCRLQSCDMTVNAVDCPSTPNPDCNCSAATQLDTTCQARLTAAYKCLLQAGPSAVKCNQSGELAIRCGVCTDEMSALTQACGVDAKCAF